MWNYFALTVLSGGGGLALARQWRWCGCGGCSRTQVSKVTFTSAALLLTATYVPSVTLYYYLLPSMSGCLHPRAPTSYPDRHRLRRRIWNIEGKTGFINPKNQVHKNVINWKIFGFQVIIFCCSFFLRVINVPVSLQQHLHCQSGRQELNFSPHHHLPDNR